MDYSHTPNQTLHNPLTGNPFFQMRAGYVFGYLQNAAGANLAPVQVVYPAGIRPQFEADKELPDSTMKEACRLSLDNGVTISISDVRLCSGKTHYHFDVAG